MNRPDINSFRQSTNLPMHDQLSKVMIDGKRLYPGQELPDLPPPNRLIVKSNALLIDDNVIICLPFTKTIMTWILACIKSWHEDDTDDEARRQLFGILDAIEKAC